MVNAMHSHETWKLNGEDIKDNIEEKAYYIKVAIDHGRINSR